MHARDTSTLRFLGNRLFSSTVSCKANRPPIVVHLFRVFVWINFDFRIYSHRIVRRYSRKCSNRKPSGVNAYACENGCCSGNSAIMYSPFLTEYYYYFFFRGVSQIIRLNPSAHTRIHIITRILSPVNNSAKSSSRYRSSSVNTTPSTREASSLWS